MQIRFTKMHGLGNDYIYINTFTDAIPENISRLCAEMSKRHFSIGSDGLVLLCPSDIADFRMRMFNADGSEGRMCGNALRCISKLAYERGLCKKTDMTVETLSGIMKTHLTIGDGDKVTLVRAELCRASFDPRYVPVVSDTEYIDRPTEVAGGIYNITALTVGSPHAVIFHNSPESLELDKIGRYFENHRLFPDRINTEFVRIIDRNNLYLRVYERGSGETYACGTGASAAVAAAVKLGLCDIDTPVCVNLIGGSLTIVCHADYSIEMTGPATEVYTGSYEFAE